MDGKLIYLKEYVAETDVDDVLYKIFAVYTFPEHFNAESLREEIKHKITELIEEKKHET